MVLLTVELLANLKVRKWYTNQMFHAYMCLSWIVTGKFKHYNASIKQIIYKKIVAMVVRLIFYNLSVILTCYMWLNMVTGLEKLHQQQWEMCMLHPKQYESKKLSNKHWSSIGTHSTYRIIGASIKWAKILRSIIFC